jgi:hypothetical protein
MEAWRQRLLGRRNNVRTKKPRIHLTPTGLLMEGDYTQDPRDKGKALISIACEKLNATTTAYGSATIAPSSPRLSNRGRW